MFKGFIKRSWSWVKTNFRNILLALLTAVVAEDKLPTSTPVIHPDDFEVAAAPEKTDNKGFYLVDVLWEREVIDEEAGQPDRTYIDQSFSTDHRLWLTAFPTLKEVDKAAGGGRFGFNIKSFLITRTLINPPKRPDPVLDVEQPDEKEKKEPVLEIEK